MIIGITKLGDTASMSSFAFSEAKRCKSGAMFRRATLCFAEATAIFARMLLPTLGRLGGRPLRKFGNAPESAVITEKKRLGSSTGDEGGEKGGDTFGLCFTQQDLQTSF
jgi:hypothetical protein